MLRELEYPFDSEQILKKSKKMKKQLLSEGSSRIKKKIAVLGGSTTHDIVRILELFLLNHGIEPSFYESEFGQYWEDAVFGNDELTDFSPDIIYIHTSNRNITFWPEIGNTVQEVDELLDRQYSHYRDMWEKIRERWRCPIIQNNMEYPFYRLLGNQDCVNISGKTSYINSLNIKFMEYARDHDNFYINDINYQSAVYGLDAWSDPFYWHMYKYSLNLNAIPWLAHNIANIVKSVYGKNKKSLVLDLDNTLWGGVVGDEGAENLDLGPETSMGQVFTEIQQYVKSLKNIGIILNIDSKNDRENALAGLNHPDRVLKPDDFIIIKANWEPKSQNILEIASEMNILPESLVFMDDNPAEREIVRMHGQGAAVPEIGTPEQYIRILDHNGYFEVTSISEDDKNRNEMYKANAMRVEQQASFTDYGEYLDSLDMHAVILPFEPIYMSRIAQLTNKSNQFNLTTKRYTQAEIEKAAEDINQITLYGKLEDKFGDNGVVSVIIGHIEEKEYKALHIDLWLMSCRVLKRDMEYAMMDKLTEICRAQDVLYIYGYYIPTAKNGMVKNFYQLQGFEKIDDKNGNTVWRFMISEDYKLKNKHISVNK